MIHKNKLNNVKYIEPSIHKESIIGEDEKIIKIINKIDKKHNFDKIILRCVKLIADKSYLKLNNLNKIFIYIHNPCLKINKDIIIDLYKKCYGILYSSELCRDEFIKIVNNNKNIINFFPCIEKLNKIILNKDIIDKKIIKYYILVVSKKDTVSKK